MILSQLPVAFIAGSGRISGEGVLPLSEQRQSFSHTILAEDETRWSCPNCPKASRALENIYDAGVYPFYFISLVSNLDGRGNKNADKRINELGLPGGGMPCVQFDGGYNYVSGAPSIPQAEANYNISIRACGNRTVANIDLHLTVTWLGSATMEVVTDAINNDGTTFQGRVRVYVTEISSTMWVDNSGLPYTYAFLDYAVNKTVTIPAGGTWTNTTVWDGHLFNDGKGHNFGNITQDNVMLIATIAHPPQGNPTREYVDETTGATPEVTNQPPNTPSNPIPVNNSENIGIIPTLSWTGGDPDAGDTVTYDVYFGTSPSPPKILPGNQSGTSYNPGALTYSTTYYWRIISWDSQHEKTIGPLWHFTTMQPDNQPPYAPYNPSPPNGALNLVMSEALVSWYGGDPDVGDLVQYEMYLGTSSDNLQFKGITQFYAYNHPNLISANLGPIKPGTKYYWKIISDDNHGASTAGPLWSFSTQQAFIPPNTPSNPSPANNSVNVEVSPELKWVGGSTESTNIITYDIFFGTDNPPVTKIFGNWSSETYPMSGLDYGITYYWRIIAWNKNHMSSPGPIWHFTTKLPANNPPYLPSNPDPSNGAVDVAVDTLISWTGGDPDIADTVTYDLYFGPVNPPLLRIHNGSLTMYNPGTLDYGTAWYWKIVAWDNHGASTPGPLWSFTTEQLPNQPPFTPEDPSPANDATDVDIATDLSWTGGDPDVGDTATYDVYFGTDNPPPLLSEDQPETTYDLPLLSADTTYFWQIISWDEHGATTPGPLWHFKTMVTDTNNPPFMASNPIPSDGTTLISIDTDIMWTGGDPDQGDTLTYDVFFGKTIIPPKVSDNQENPYYDPGFLSYDTRYYWMIITTDNHGASTMGPLWSFTTRSQVLPNQPPYIPTDPHPTNGATQVVLSADLSWTGGDPNQGDIVKYDVYFGNTSSPSKKASNQSSTTYDPGSLLLNTTYYWKIVAWDNSGASTAGTLWSFTTLKQTTSTLKVSITKPKAGYKYTSDSAGKKRAFSTTPLIIGKLTIEANATDIGSSITKVEFYIDGVRKGNDTTSPYTWMWNTFSVSKHTIKVIAYNALGKNATAEIQVRKIF